jgi:hypothetical protein
MGQEALPLVETGQGNNAAVVIEDLEEVKWRVVGAKPAVGRGVVWPELADVLDLPASRRLAVAAGMPRGPRALAAPGTSPQVVGVKDVEPTADQAKFAGGIEGRDFAPPKHGQNVADERRRMSSAQLLVVFFKSAA